MRGLNLRGIYIQKENHRFYPQRCAGGPRAGLCGHGRARPGGIEYEFDKKIRGRPGHMLVMADAKRRWYDRSEAAAEPGASVVLTIDETIQYIAERELAAAIEETHAKSGIGRGARPQQRRDFCAVANWPNFDPNNAGQRQPMRQAWTARSARRTSRARRSR